MKKLFNKIFISILSFFTLFDKKNNVESNHIHQEQIRNVSGSEDNFNFSNLIVFARFKDDDEFVDNTSLDGFLTLIDDTFNNSSYSISSYMNSISNNHIKMRYLYLFNNGGSIQLEHNRGYYTSYSSLNNEGYKSDTEKTQRMEELRMDWSDKINELLLKGEKITNLDSNKEYSYSDLDRYAFQNKYERIIDNITIIFKKDNDSSLEVNWGDPLSTYHDKTNRVEIGLSSGGRLFSSNYVQVFLDYDYTYSLDDSSITLNTNIIAHETCHAIGLFDLYSGTTQQSPCGYMSKLGKKIGPIGQFITAKERDYLNFLSSTNLIEIKEDGNYTVNLTKDSYQDEVIAYKIVLPSKKELYFEYRAFNSSLNRFDNITKIVNNKEMMSIDINSGLIVSRVNYPNNSLNNLNVKGSDWVYEVLADSSSLTKTKAALNSSNKSLITDGIQIDFISINDDKLTFSIKNMPKASVTSIDFTSSKESIKLGESFKYEVSLNGENTYYSNISYSVNKNTSINTNVDNTGLLTIASDEKSNQIDLIVTASNYKRILPINIDTSCTHEMYYYSRVEPTCFNTGNIAFYKCNKCNKYFLDFEGKNEITSSIVISKLEHVLSDYIIDREPTYTSNGHRHKECLLCHTRFNEEEIPMLIPSSSSSSSSNSSMNSSSNPGNNSSVSSSNISNSSDNNKINYEKSNNLPIILMSVFIPFGSICLISLIYFIIKKKPKK